MLFALASGRRRAQTLDYGGYEALGRKYMHSVQAEEGKGPSLHSLPDRHRRVWHTMCSQTWLWSWGSRCWSSVGRQFYKRGAQDISLGSGCFKVSHVNAGHWSPRESNLWLLPVLYRYSYCSHRITNQWPLPQWCSSGSRDRPHTRLLSRTCQKGQGFLHSHNLG